MKAKLTILALLLSALCSGLSAQNLKVNDLEYFEERPIGEYIEQGLGFGGVL